MNPHEKALNGIFDDMDDFESKKMFGKPDEKGVSITISVQPGHQEPDGDEAGKPDHDEAMCKGGCAYHKGGIAMSDGGQVPMPPEGDDLNLPPFLRKKKGMNS